MNYSAMRKLKIFFAIFSLVFIMGKINIIGAQTTTLTDMGISIPVVDQNVTNGDIICSDSKGYELCRNEYDSSIYGIVNSSAAAVLSIPNLPNSEVVVSKGETAVRVSSVNGNIKKGDLLTTSKIAGVAELASKTGYVIGTALADYSSADKTAVSLINISLNIHASTDASNTRENLVDVLRSGLSGLGSNPIAALRYILAAAMVVTSFTIGFIYFGRIAKSGVEAIGRNPLAGTRIETSVFINVIIMAVVILVGLAVAYLILAI
jgi:F0F1-type ATP synthase membrane subunit c/vacuolar-type H+-ATPase subunit K